MSETTICFEKTGEFRLPRLSEYWLFEGEVLHGISPAGPDQRREILQRKDMPNVTTLLATAKASNTTLRAQLSTLAQQLAASEARVAELEAGRPTSIERLESAEAKHTGMRCDVVNMLFQAGLSNRQFQASLNQLADHLTELTTRWLAGDETAIAEFVALYCISARCKKPANAGSE